MILQSSHIFFTDGLTFMVCPYLNAKEAKAPLPTLTLCPLQQWAHAKVALGARHHLFFVITLYLLRGRVNLNPSNPYIISAHYIKVLLAVPTFNYREGDYI